MENHKDRIKCKGNHKYQERGECKYHCMNMSRGYCDGVEGRGSVRTRK
jgi:hypothetical protein